MYLYMYVCVCMYVCSIMYFHMSSIWFYVCMYVCMKLYVIRACLLQGFPALIGAAIRVGRSERRVSVGW